MKFKLIEVDGSWFVAFRDKMGYGDYVIEFSQSFGTKEAAELAAKTGSIRPYNTSHEK